MLRLFKNGVYNQFKSLNSCRGEIEMPVASFFEHTRQRHEVHTWMNKGILPVKYAYVGSGAYAHQKLTATRGYQKVTGRGKDELRALLHSMPSSEIPEQIAEVGLGTGVHTASFLQALRQAGHPAKRFLGFDFSEALLNIGSTHLRSKFPEGLDIRSQYWDAEASPTSKIENWRQGKEPVLVCTLGGTPVAFESSQPALSHLYRSTRENDLLLYSLILRPEGATDEELLEPYQNDIFRAAIAEPLYAAGLTSGDFDIELSVKNDSVVGEAVMQKDQQLDDLRLRRGQRIRNFTSHRFNQHEIDELFAHTGWDVITKAPTGDMGILVIARRQKDANVGAKISTLLPVSADWMASAAPLVCTGNHIDDSSCSWYHGVWQYLRLFDLASSPTWHDTFYQQSLLATLKKQANVLISGTADYSMLAYVLEANTRLAANAEINVIDRCPTPMIACQWYASKHGSPVALHALGVDDVQSLSTKFDLIVADAFLTRFEQHEVQNVLATWHDNLQKDGNVVTTVRIHQSEPPISDAEIERFVDRARQAAMRWDKKLITPVDDIVAHARQWAQQMRSNKLGSARQVLDLFEANGFTVTSHELAQVRGELRPSSYLRIVARKYGQSPGRPRPFDALLFDAISEKQIIPLKFAYTGPAVQKHLNLAKLDSYKEVTDAATVEAALVKMQKAMPAICDIGPGDGQHSQAFLRQLMKQGRTTPDYLGLDFSDELATVAESRIRPALTPTIAFKHWDVEAAPTNTIRTFTGAPQKTIVTFLGQTLGNVENPLQTLQNVRDSVAPGDQLLLSVALQSPTRTSADYLRPYQNPTFMEAIAEPLRMVGLRVEHGELTLAYEDNAVVGKFTLLKDQIIQHPSRPAASLPKGTVIRCFMSRRFKQKGIEEMLNKAGWRKTNYVHQNKGSIGVYLATACEPHTRKSGANP